MPYLLGIVNAGPSRIDVDESLSYNVEAPSQPTEEPMPEPVFPPDAGNLLAAAAHTVLSKIAEAHPTREACAHAIQAEIEQAERSFQRPSFIDVPNPIERALLAWRSAVLRFALEELKRADPGIPLPDLFFRIGGSLGRQATALRLEPDGRIVRPEPGNDPAS